MPRVVPLGPLGLLPEFEEEQEAMLIAKPQNSTHVKAARRGMRRASHANERNAKPQIPASKSIRNPGKRREGRGMKGRAELAVV